MKRGMLRGMGFFFLTLILTSRIGGRNQDIVLCMGMIFGTNLGTRP
jgi:hypothetical protein